jgi:hypothetical protein
MSYLVLYKLFVWGVSLSIAATLLYGAARLKYTDTPY